MNLTSKQQQVLAEAAQILEQMATYETTVVDRPQVVMDIFQHRLAGKSIEVFSVAYLNNAHGIIKIEDACEGTVNKATVYPREIVKRALELNASAMIISHNHPSGSRNFSQADIEVTKKLEAACEMFEIRVLDHILVAGGEVVSMAQTIGM